MTESAHTGHEASRRNIPIKGQSFPSLLNYRALQTRKTGVPATVAAQVQRPDPTLPAQLVRRSRYHLRSPTHQWLGSTSHLRHLFVE